jgi:hypothetical protein
MTPEERVRIFDQLSTVLISDFQNDFHQVLAEAYAVTSFTPEQANNEIRNAMLHCARTCAAATMDDAQKNIEEARWHIGLAKRDCFQICILKIRENIERILEITEYRYKTIKTADRERLKAIALASKALVKRAYDPTTRQDQNLTDEFEAVYNEISDFEEHILRAYPVTRTSRGMAYRAWLKAAKISNSVGLWIIGVFIIAILSSSIMPQGIKVYYNQGMKYLFCRITSNSFCN